MGIYVAPRTVVQKASPQGPGAGILQTEFPLLAALGKQTDQSKMERAWKLGISVPWIRAAERVIGGAFVNVPWHLEDENEEAIEEGDAYDLIATPQLNLPDDRKKLTRSDLWRLTCRHMGLCGNAFWYLDGLNTYGQPTGILYIRPDRMTPVDNEAGNLIGWLIDKTPTSPGIGVKLDQIVQFMFEPPDIGHFGIGLVESALLKASLSTALDQHLAQILSAGGHLSGIMAPKTGVLGPDQMVSLERDWRSVVEQSDPAKRLQLVAAPVDFTPTVMSPTDIALTELMGVMRDSLLGLWGVPVSKLGIHDRGKGLAGANVLLEDDATLWQEGVKPRLGGQDEGGFVESLQQLLDRFATTDGVTELVIDEPTFDDDAPKYENAQKAVSLPLRNRERRDILGLDPLGEDVINPETGIALDDEVWMPINMVRAFIAPEDGKAVPMPEAPAPVEPDSSAANAAGETRGQTASGTSSTLVQSKADSKAVIPDRVKPLHESLVKLRANIDTHMTPKVEASVRAFLTEQRRDIAERIRKHAAHLTHDPGDSSVWFPARVYDQKLEAALAPVLQHVATDVSGHIESALGSPLKGELNVMTKDRVQALISDGVAGGRSMEDIADAVEVDEIETYIGMIAAEVPDINAKAMGLDPVVAAMLKAAIEFGQRPQLAPIVNVAQPDIRVEAPVIITNVPEQPAPIVNVEAAKANPLMPDIVINVPEQPAPVIHVNVPEDRPKRVIYKGDGKVDRVEPY